MGRIAALTRRTAAGRAWPALAALAPLLVAAGTADQGEEHYDSSLLAWVDAVGDALEERATAVGLTRLDLEVTGGRGVADRKAQRVFLPRLAERLGTGGRIAVGGGGPVARIELSLLGGRVWAVGLLDGDGLAGPLAVAVSWPVDRELEALLGSGATRFGQARWTMQRLGTVPAGVLDAALVDLDDDGGDEIVLLGVDGVRTFRFAPGEARPEPLGGPWALPGDLPWPRTVAGWLAPADGTDVEVATTAGHAARLDAATGRWSPGEVGVPLGQGDAARRPLRAALIGAGPDLGLDGPVAGSRPAPEGASADFPPAMRDAVRVPGAGDAWIWVAADGTLGGRAGDRRATLPEGRFGDRLLAADLDDLEGAELVTTSSSGPGEPDVVTIHRVDRDLQGTGVLFASPLDGAVAAFAAGDVDFDGAGDVLVVEEGPGDLAVLWRIERSDR